MSEEHRFEIPIAELSAGALIGVVDEYVLREGTEYGATDVTLERKREHVLAQLRSGEAVVTFDKATETCTIVLRAT
jgi:uncharacterized protein YheU (UPF0270 family)